MAGDWIKFEVSTLDKPEVCQIADMAEIDPDAAVGKLLRVWAWFDQQTEKGNAPSVSKKLLDRLVGVSGFCDFMMSVGWMESQDGMINLPNFDRHNGKTAKNRALTAKRVADHKGKSNAPSVSGALANALPREEKRREEIEQPPICPQEGTKEKGASRKTKIPTPFLLTAAMRSWAAEDAPGVDLKTETEKFVDYWRGEAKTKADWPATWRNWMRKAQQDINRPGPRNSAPINRQQQIEDANQAVVREIYAREERRKQEELGLCPEGETVTLEGEAIHVD